MSRRIDSTGNIRGKQWGTDCHFVGVAFFFHVGPQAQTRGGMALNAGNDFPAAVCGFLSVADLVRDRMSCAKHPNSHKFGYKISLPALSATGEALVASADAIPTNIERLMGEESAPE